MSVRRSIFFNCYRHWSSLVLKNGNGVVIFLHSREGVTQRDPLAMVTYVIGVILLEKFLKVVYPEVTQPRYADDAGALGMFDNIGLYFNSLK